MPAARPTTLSAALSDIQRDFTLDTAALNALKERFIQLMDHGLAHTGADMAMIPAYVTGVPDGTEKGTYLALDLGGTNLRVCEVTLRGDGTFGMKQEKYKVSDALKRGPIRDLMDYIANSVDTFLTDFGSSESEGLDEIHMGFTFSFPVEQTAIDRGTLIKWTKGFDCPDAPGKDVIQLLQASLDRKHIKVKVSALVNDTVGALLAHAYQSGGAFIGAIFGTGTNGAYVANIDDVKKLKLKEGSGLSKPDKMLINTEWGGFDDDAQARTPQQGGLPITPYDNYVDRTSIRPRHHCFEKMTSGMYLGEVCRAVLLDLVDRLLLFQGRSSPALNTQYALDTAYVSTIVGDTATPDDTSSPTRAVLVQTMGIPDMYVSPADVAAVRTVCDFVTLRAARVSAVPIAATIVHTGEDARDDINVGVDGSVVEFVPRFQERILAAVREMVGDQTADKIRFGMAKDGSGVGAALCALQAVKQAEAGHAV